MTSDAELLRRYAEERSETAFAELVHRRLDLVYAVALRKLGPYGHLAEDVAQRVFTDLAAKAVTLSRHPSLVGWLFTSTHFAAAQAARAEYRRQRREEKAHTMNELYRESAPVVDWEQLRPVLDELICKLGQRDRDAVLMRFFEGRTLAELGRELGLTEKGAHSRIERSLAKLQSMLGRRGITSTATALSTALVNQVGIAAPAGLATTISGSALAAASAATPGLGLMSFISTPKALVTMAAALGLVVTGISLYEWPSSKRTRTVLETVVPRDALRQQQVQASLNDMRAAEQAGAAAQEKSSGLQERGPSQAVAATPPTAAPAAGGRLDVTKAKSDWQRFAAAHPEAASSMAEHSRISVAGQYRLFFEQARLTPEQIHEFVTRTGAIGTLNLAISPAIDVIPSTVTKLPDDELRAMLGERAFQQFQDFHRMGDAIDFVAVIRKEAGLRGVPLSSDQEVELAQIVTDHSPEFQRGQALKPLSVDWATAATQAQILFSASQWSIVENYFVGRQWSQTFTKARDSQAANSPAAKDMLPANSASSPPPTPNPYALIASDPKLRALYLETWRRSAAWKYGAIYQSLGLTAAQIGKFEDLGTAREDELLTMRATRDRSVMKQSDVEFHATLSSEVAPGMGEAIVRQNSQGQRLQRMPVVQNRLNDVLLRIPLGSPPMTSLQVEQLTEILANSSPSYRSGGNIGTAYHNDIDWDNAYDKAAAILSGGQLQALKSVCTAEQVVRLVKQFYAKEQAGGP